MTEPTQDSAREQATDAFIEQNLPDWLKKASHEQLNTLRTCFTQHIQSQNNVQQAFARLQPLDTFAAMRLQERLLSSLSLTVEPDKAQWREERRRLVADATGPTRHEAYFVHLPALARLMQNFKRAEPFFEQTGLVYPADISTGEVEQVLTTDSARLVETCRALDIGQQYQEHLDSVLDANCLATLAEDKRRQLRLAVELAALKRQLPEDDLNMLRRVVEGKPASHAQSQRVVAGALQVLGCRVEGALAFERQSLTIPFRHIPPFIVQAVVLYLPGDPEQPLRTFENWREASLAMGLQLQDPAFQRAFIQRIALAERVAFLSTSSKRLADAKPDASCSCEAVDGPLLPTLAAQQLQRIRDNARFLAVPTARVDARVSAEHWQKLESVGMGLLNLAGLFVPAIGTLLAVGWVAQTLSQVCEGVEDWSQGHQHEAIEHLLGVVETVVVATALIGGTALVARGFARSAQIDRLVPVLNDAGESRLWADEISHYEDPNPPADLLVLDNGLLAKGQGRWWRNADRYYQVQPVPGRSAWQLRHPRRQAGFGPLLEYNGERSWRLATERPIEWAGEHLLLGRLWPAVADLKAEYTAQVLKVAGVDQEHLRGLLVEGRPLPVQLRDTLERFATDARVDAFINRLEGGQEADSELFQWCSDYLKLDTLSLDEQRLEFVDCQALLREQLFEHFSRKYLADDPLLGLIQRDFKGLPDAYALDVLGQASDTQRQWMLSEQRVPFAVAERARAHMQLAHLTRMREGLYLKGSYQPGTVELVFALLCKHARLSQTLNFELREGSDVGPVQAQLHADGGAQQTTITLVRQPGGFKCYDAQGRELEDGLADAAPLQEVLAKHLAASDLARLTWDGTRAGEQILNAMRIWLPTDRKALLALMGLREIKPPSNPMHRLADGRVGYLLSGRGAQRYPSRRVLMRAVGALYPSFDAQDVDSYVARLLESPRTAYAIMILQSREYIGLDQALRTWTDEVPVGSQRETRVEVANTFRRSWRLDGERINPEATNRVTRLSLVGLDLGHLPTLPANTNFGHVTDLVLVGLRLEALSPGFLRCFSRLRWLNLSNNALAGLPAEIGELQQMTTLRLARNRIRMAEGAVQTLANMTQLQTLDLSFNPIGSVSLRLGELSRLRDLNLRRANLQHVPVGLERCAALELADLRDNQIAYLPDNLILAPLHTRQAIVLQNNPLPVADRERLIALHPVQVSPPLRADGAFAQTRANWLLYAPTPENPAYQRQWDELLAAPDSEEFFRLLRKLTDTSDYRQVPQDLARRVWAVIDAASEDAALRGELFELAASGGCVDRVITCFSTMEVRVLLAQVVRGGDLVAQQTSLLGLARGLFRLEQVEAIAQLDIDRRVALEEDRLRNTGLSIEESAALAREHVDEVEVNLAYRIGLARRLGLPGQPQTMQFERLAGVTQAQLDNAAASVRWSSATPALQAYISRRDYWIEYLERRYSARFELVKQPFWNQLEELQGLTDSEQLARTAHVHSAFKQAVDDLVQDLTREALQDWRPQD